MWDFLPQPRRAAPAWPSTRLSISFPLPQTRTQSPGQSPASRPPTLPICGDGLRAYPPRVGQSSRLQPRLQPIPPGRQHSRGHWCLHRCEQMEHTPQTQPPLEELGQGFPGHSSKPPPLSRVPRTSPGSTAAETRGHPGHPSFGATIQTSVAHIHVWLWQITPHLWFSKMTFTT